MFFMSTFIGLRWRKDMQRICKRCITYRQAKHKILPHGLYTSLLVPKEPYVDISMDFVLGLPKSKNGYGFYFYGCR